MANSADQTTSLSSKGQEASLKACRSCSDKISNLPDALIHRILSFLSTKQAVATSVLSKRWVCLWTLVPTLDLEDSDRCRIDEQAKMKFVHFVYRVLLLNKASSVEKFRLNCRIIYGHSCINTWICSVIERGLQEVDISASKIAKDDLVKLPSGFFLMKTLKILKLRGGIFVDVPGSVCFPSLKILHLLRINYAIVESVRRLISGCPSLEELCIDARISQENMVNINISTPTLNSLSLTLTYDFHHEPREKKVEINAPALKYFNFSSSSLKPHHYFVENFPCLIEANISVHDCYRIQLFRALNGVKCLKLLGVLVFLAVARNSFPSFVNLTRLELRGGISWFVVSLFLQNSPKLETLVVHNKIFTRNDVGLQWTQPKLVPICFLSSLTRACFENFEGLKDELKMVEYFLKNARVLRTMEIYTSDLSSDSKLCVIKKLSMFPRRSETCQLSFN